MVTLYMVTLSKIETPEQMRFFTITDNKKDCELYINKKLKIDYIEHFKMWCDLREIPMNDDSWSKYVMTDFVDKRKYVIRRMKYKVKDLASILRLSNGCIPIGCGYESKEEYEAFLRTLPPEKLEEFNKKLEEECND